MARPKVTAAALQKARELAAECKERPVVIVSWTGPSSDNSRGLNGETIWTHVSTGQWSVHVTDVHVKKGAEVPTVKIGGLEFLLVGRDLDQSFSGITIDYADGQLVVREAI